MREVLLDIKFWTGLLDDHAAFILSSLAPSEKKEIAAAKDFREKLSNLHNRALSTNGNLDALVVDVKEEVILFTKFKKYLLNGALNCSVKINMTPSFLDHLVSEALEFLRLILMYEDGNHEFNLREENIRSNHLWLFAETEHMALILASLDYFVYDIRAQADTFARFFNGFLQENTIINEMNNRAEVGKSLLLSFNNRVIKEVKKYIDFLSQLEENRKVCSPLMTGTFISLIPNHMIREANYHIEKLNLYNTLLV